MKRSVFPFLVLVASTVSYAQVPPMDPSTWGILNFQTNLGSFKILRDRSRPAEGRFEATFSGTMLVRGAKGIVEVTGNVKPEIERKDKGITVYFGTGRIAINGHFDAIQWFGKNLKAKFNGFGLVRLYGEFDKDLNTGTYWESDPTDVKYWAPSGTTIGVPNNYAPSVKPVERGKAGQKPPQPRP